MSAYNKYIWYIHIYICGYENVLQNAVQKMTGWFLRSYFKKSRFLGLAFEWCLTWPSSSSWEWLISFKQDLQTVKYPVKCVYTGMFYPSISITPKIWSGSISMSAGCSFRARLHCFHFSTTLRCHPYFIQSVVLMHQSKHIEPLKEHKDRFSLLHFY